MLLLVGSVTQSVFEPAICGPAVMALSCAFGATPVNSVMTPAGVTRPISPS